MNKLLIALVVSFLFITPVFAEESSPSSLQAQFKQKREELQQKIQAEKTALKSQLAMNVEARKASASARKAELKDKKKEEILSRVSDNLNKINQNAASHFTKFLEKTEMILTKLEERVDKKGSEGKDTTEAKTAIASAKTAIQTAKDAVATQSAKDYTISTATDATARSQAQTMRDQLRDDLKATKALVEAAKKSVSTAIRISMTTLGGKEASGSGEAQP